MRVVFLFLVCFFISSPAQSDYTDHTGISAIGSGEAVVVHDSTSLTRADRKVRESAVKISSPDGFIYGSGSYFTHEGNHIVVTAAHVVREAATMIVIGRDGERVFGSVVYSDEARDVAILRVPNMRTRTPMALSFSDTSMEKIIGCSVVYTGFPGGHDLVTIKGSIAGIVPERNFILMHGYAWMGASGSGVFDKKGNLVGVLSAVSVGSHFDLQIIEDMVWISPVTQIDQEALINSLSEK